MNLHYAHVIHKGSDLVAKKHPDLSDILRAALKVKPTADMPTTKKPKKAGVSAQTNNGQLRKKASKKKHK